MGGRRHAASLTDVEASGETLARLMCEAMRRAGIRPAQVDYVHAHGTATVTNDLAECGRFGAPWARRAEG